MAVPKNHALGGVRGFLDCGRGTGIGNVAASSVVLGREGVSCFGGK